MTFNFLQKSILQSVYYRETRVFLKQKNIYVCKYRVFIKYCVFFLQILLFFLTLPVLLQCWCSTCLAH